jgi:hypothetical protein
MQQARPLTLLLVAPLLIGLAAAFTTPLHAQQTKTITVLLYDGKTGRQLIPDNYVIRIDHLDATHNEWLNLKDDGSGVVAVPATATFLGVQAAYHKSMDLYINCDAAMEKDTSTLHWYSISDILTSGVAAANECYKGKFADATHVTPKPGQFVFFVRPIGPREALAD